MISMEEKIAMAEQNIRLAMIDYNEHIALEDRIFTGEPFVKRLAEDSTKAKQELRELFLEDSSKLARSMVPRLCSSWLTPSKVSLLCPRERVMPPLGITGKTRTPSLLLEDRTKSITPPPGLPEFFA